MIHNNVIFNYVLNLQGDVQQIRRTDGTVVATYLYNAWGYMISMSGSMAELNPLRYRGYYFCSTTGFYYLQSRYYCLWIGRFINVDALAVLAIDSRKDVRRCDTNPLYDFCR